MSELPQGRIRAVHGGGFVRVCPVCTDEVADVGVEVEVFDERVDARGDVVRVFAGYTTEVDDTNYRQHFAERHAGG